MKNILLTYFSSVHTLESFLTEINLTFAQSDEEKLKKCIKNLSHIFIAFDFKLSGPFKSYVDRRFTYEQLIYLCFMKINESASTVKFYESHMFKSNNYATIAKNFKNILNLPPNELEKRLASTENLSICYFLSRKNGENFADGIYWRELFDLIGSSITKYIILYSSLFRKIQNNKNVYVQVSGLKFCATFRDLIREKLELDEILVKEKIQTRGKFFQKSDDKKAKEETIIDGEGLQIEKSNSVIKETKSVKLNTVFDTKEEAIKQEANRLKTVKHQLEKLGHQKLNKTSILYDRYLGSKISARYIFSNQRLAVGEEMGKQIMEKFIFHSIDLSLYSQVEQINEAKACLNKILLKFVAFHRTCPYKVFLHCYCERERNMTTETAAKNKLAQSVKRDREGKEILNGNNNK